MLALLFELLIQLINNIGLFLCSSTRFWQAQRQWLRSLEFIFLAERATDQDISKESSYSPKAMIKPVENITVFGRSVALAVGSKYLDCCGACDWFCWESDGDNATPSSQDPDMRQVFWR